MSKQILVVDDEVGIRELLAEFYLMRVIRFIWPKMPNKRVPAGMNSNPIWCCWISGCLTPMALRC